VGGNGATGGSRDETSTVSSRDHIIAFGSQQDPICCLIVVGVFRRANDRRALRSDLEHRIQIVGGPMDRADRPRRRAAKSAYQTIAGSKQPSSDRQSRQKRQSNGEKDGPQTEERDHNDECRDAIPNRQSIKLGHNSPQKTGRKTDLAAQGWPRR